MRPGEVELEDRFTGARRTVAAAVVDCGYNPIDALRARGWAALPERGTPAMLRLISWIALRMR